MGAPSISEPATTVVRLQRCITSNLLTMLEGELCCQTANPLLLILDWKLGTQVLAPV